MGNARQSSEYRQLQALKRAYIPLACAGRCTIAYAAARIGITPRAVSYLKRRYRLRGPAAFTNGHAGKLFLHLKFSPARRAWICHEYRARWNGANFAMYREMLLTLHGIKIAPLTLKKILEADGIKSPKWRGSSVEKKLYKPRKERKREGELTQLDASSYDWLMTGETTTITGGIDDATHKITGLYMTKHECRFGYSEVERQKLERYGASAAVYIDRHATLVKNARRRNKTLEECLQYSKYEATHWTELCAACKTEIILALSPQAKGRIERLWQTLQGRLPFLFRYHGITTIAEANNFLKAYIEVFNARFSVAPQESKSAYHAPPLTPAALEFLLQVRTKKTTKEDGTFVFHGFTFHLDAPRAACRSFTLCMSERDGVRAYIGGKYYPVTLVDPLIDCIDDVMSQVEKELVARYCLGNQRGGVYR